MKAYTDDHPELQEQSHRFGKMTFTEEQGLTTLQQELGFGTVTQLCGLLFSEAFQEGRTVRVQLQRAGFFHPAGSNANERKTTHPRSGGNSVGAWTRMTCSLSPHASLPGGREYITVGEGCRFRSTETRLRLITSSAGSFNLVDGQVARRGGVVSRVSNSWENAKSLSNDYYLLSLSVLFFFLSLSLSISFRAILLDNKL